MPMLSTAHRPARSSSRRTRRVWWAYALVLVAFIVQCLAVAAADAGEVSSLTASSVDSLGSTVLLRLPSGASRLLTGRGQTNLKQGGALGLSRTSHVVLVSLSCRPATGVGRSCWLMNTPVTGGHSVRVSPKALPNGVISVAEWKTTLVIGRSSPSPAVNGTWIRTGNAAWHRVSPHAAETTIIRGTFVVSQVFLGDSRVGILAFTTRDPKAIHSLAATAGMLDCHCGGIVSDVSSPALAGHFAYWLETSSPAVSGTPPLTLACRVDLTALDRPVAEWHPPFTIGSLSVTDTRLYATAGSFYMLARGVFSFTPTWNDATKPLQGEAGNACATTS